MKVLEFVKGTGNVFAPTDLGALWDEAERIGKVKLETCTFTTNGKYEAEIAFDLDGSRIYARGRSDDRDDAVKKAIAAARRLGNAA